MSILSPCSGFICVRFIFFLVVVVIAYFDGRCCCCCCLCSSHSVFGWQATAPGCNVLWIRVYFQACKCIVFIILIAFFHRQVERNDIKKKLKTVFEWMKFILCGAIEKKRPTYFMVIYSSFRILFYIFICTSEVVDFRSLSPARILHICNSIVWLDSFHFLPDI